MSHHLNGTIGTLFLVGGAFAFFKKKSMASLIGGSVLGSLFLISSYMIKEGNYENGFLLGSCISFTGAGMMGTRFIKTGKFMPAGLIFTLSFASLIYNGNKY